MLLFPAFKIAPPLCSIFPSNVAPQKVIKMLIIERLFINVRRVKV